MLTSLLLPARSDRCLYRGTSFSAAPAYATTRLTCYAAPHASEEDCIVCGVHGVYGPHSKGCETAQNVVSECLYIHRYSIECSLLQDDVLLSRQTTAYWSCGANEV